MITRRFGRTGLDMPVFSCGGMRFQQSWRDKGQPITEESQANLTATITRALDLGINHIETARAYGTSERQIGMLWDDVDRDRVILQTKIRPTADPREFEAHFAESLERLQTDRVELLALHGVNTYEYLFWALRPGGCLDSARRLQEAGKVGHIGLSTHGSLDMIHSAIDAGFDFINLHWYLIFQRNWPAIEAAAAADMGVFIISPSDKGGQLYKPSDRLTELCSPLHPLVLNALYCLQHPQVHTLSIGASSPGDFDLALTSLPDVETAAEVLAEPMARLTDAMAQSIGPGAWEQISAGIPSWEHCPGLINVELVVLLRAVMLGWGMDDFARWRYQGLSKEADWVPGMNAAAAPDLDFTHALREAPLRTQIIEWLGDAHELLG